MLVGDFRIEGLTPVPDANELLCRMRLDLDGILEVTAVEKRTGKARQITIANALHAKTAEEIAAGRRRIQELYSPRGEVDSAEWEEPARDEDHGVASGSGPTAVRQPPRAPHPALRLLAN